MTSPAEYIGAFPGTGARLAHLVTPVLALYDVILYPPAVSPVRSPTAITARPSDVTAAPPSPPRALSGSSHKHLPVAARNANVAATWCPYLLETVPAT